MGSLLCSFGFACPSPLMRRNLRPSLGVRNANCGFKGNVGVGKHQRNSKPHTCLALQPLPKSSVKMWRAQPAGRMPVGTAAARAMPASAPAEGLVVSAGL